jgi:CMP-N,N'-diacetyllegionaminic acid synthase
MTRIKNRPPELDAMNQILAIIPARLGSKRLSKKNIRMLHGIPLLAYTINSVKNSKYVNRFIVSTEDREIAQISQSYGAEVIMRPLELARDESSTEDVIINVLEQLRNKEQYTPNIIILLQPTSPLRTTEDINNAIKTFLNSSGDSLIGITEYDHTPYWALRIEKGLLIPEFTKESLKRSQDLPKLYRPNGSLFITRVKTFLKNRSFYTNKIIPFIMPRERSIDIDDELDFAIAEFLLKSCEGEN